MPAVEIVIARLPEYLDDAGQIWAEATAARDGEPAAAALDASRPLIERVVSGSPNALLLIALDDNRRAVGFAAVEPVGAADEHRAELRYIGVCPRAWGRGVAQRLLAALRDELANRSFVEAELWVYRDNPRAVALYQQMGWQAGPDVRVHPRSGRHEQRYTLCVLQGP